MKRLSTIMRRDKGDRNGSNATNSQNTNGTAQPPINNGPEPPEAVAVRNVRLFCESASPGSPGDEVLFLPPIVEAAESSPAAAAAAGVQIRQFLGKSHCNKPHVQYNAVMLLRILSDNPGPSFTRSLDDKFKDNVKWLLKTSRDPSVQQILRETLDHFAIEKEYDENLRAVITMWKKERGPDWQPRPPQAASQMPAYGFGGHPVTALGRWQTPRAGRPPQWEQPPPEAMVPTNSLPPPQELFARIEEAKNSATLLVQFCNSTPPAELTSSELLSEFSTRCQSAQQNLTGYMNATCPAPDEDTLQTLIETVEQLSVANSRHQRAVLAARRQDRFVSGFNAPNQPLGVGSAGRAKPVASFGPPSPPPPTMPPRPAVPQPPTNMLQQLHSRDEDSVGPAPQYLYPTAQEHPATNPFGDDHEVARHSAFANNHTEEYNSYNPQPTTNDTIPENDDVYTAPPGPPPTQQASDHSMTSQEHVTPYAPRNNGKGKLPLGRPPPPPIPTQSQPRTRPQHTPQQSNETNGLYAPPTPLYEPLTPFSQEPPTPMIASPPTPGGYPAYNSPFYNTFPNQNIDRNSTANTSAPRPPLPQTSPYGAYQAPSTSTPQDFERPQPAVGTDPWAPQRQHWSSLNGSSNPSSISIYGQPHHQPPSIPLPPLPSQPAYELEAPASPPKPARSAPAPPPLRGGVVELPAEMPMKMPISGDLETDTDTTSAVVNGPSPAQSDSQPPMRSRPQQKQARMPLPVQMGMTSAQSFVRRQDEAARGLVMSGGVGGG